MIALDTVNATPYIHKDLMIPINRYALMMLN